MYNNQKIGVGIITCNREQRFRQLFDKVLHNSCVDSLIVVKNKEFSYHENDPLNLTGPYLPQLNCTHALVDIHYQHVKGDVGVGYCKNVALKYLMQCNCEHLFLIEDDIDIKDDNVFKQYIDTAKSFNLQHLIFGAVYTPPSWQIDEIVHTVQHDDYLIDMYKNLHGGFVYFTKKCIQYCGLFDERYVNAVEHIDHTYRIINFGFYTPFWAFADIHDSQKYLSDLQPENPSTINNNAQQQQRVIDGMKLFANTWNVQVRNIPHPTTQDISNFLKWRIHHV